MVSEREEIRRKVMEAVGGRPVRWTDHRTTKGDFPGRDWTLEVFDVPIAEQKALHSRLFRGIRRQLWEEKRLCLMTLFHTPENTDRYYAWVREEHAAERAGVARATP
ncbi:hypothetical protein [Archangium violaceum]|uniref:Uncharacterized protein n=1 Tax=Archangium violaceum Cb vi76 TaxID=1406225 RepID=A0A084SIS4_9BACT|nr:hypothetical protein [Archangium violaceum]KFA88359.1 hypothetical protein Q664_41600 [Archangium violaceum Cb vi76]